MTPFTIEHHEKYLRLNHQYGNEYGRLFAGGF